MSPVRPLSIYDNYILTKHYNAINILEAEYSPGGLTG